MISVISMFSKVWVIHFQITVWGGGGGGRGGVCVCVYWPNRLFPMCWRKPHSSSSQYVSYSKVKSKSVYFLKCRALYFWSFVTNDSEQLYKGSDRIILCRKTFCGSSKASEAVTRSSEIPTQESLRKAAFVSLSAKLFWDKEFCFCHGNKWNVFSEKKCSPSFPVTQEAMELWKSLAGSKQQAFN